MGIIYIFIEMKYTSALVIAALLGAAFVGESQAVQLKTGYTDDLIKSLTEDMQKEAVTGESAEATEEAKPVEKKVEKKAPKKEEKKAKKSTDKKKDSKKSKDKKEETKKPKKKEEVEDIPMDAAAIKAYSSVIADAAEDSEPQVPVQYHETMTEEPAPKNS